MGKKRNKVTNTEDTHIEKKNCKLEKEEIEEVNLNNDNVTTTSKHTKKNKNNDNKLLKSVDEETKVKKKHKVKSTEIPNNELATFEKTKKIKHKISETVGAATISKKNKKIVFIDDKPQEVPDGSERVGTSVEKKNKKFLNDDEAEVKEEDIDQFCDELDEEDNKQYENWVKLIEDKLHSNKKT